MLKELFIKIRNFILGIKGHWGMWQDGEEVVFRCSCCGYEVEMTDVYLPCKEDTLSEQVTGDVLLEDGYILKKHCPGCGKRLAFRTSYYIPSDW